MELQELGPGLWRWTAAHPGWSAGAEPESPADWPESVGSVAVRVDGGIAFIDALVPDGDGFEQLDALVREGDRVWALTTIQFHRRSRDAVAAEYGASTSRARAELPAEIEPIPIEGAGETMFWLPGQRALVPGDRLLGDGQGGLRLCPESWLGYLPSGITIDGLREALTPVLELPVEMVLASHGEPVLSGGAEAIERALSL